MTAATTKARKTFIDRNRIKVKSLSFSRSKNFCPIPIGSRWEQLGKTFCASEPVAGVIRFSISAKDAIAAKRIAAMNVVAQLVRIS